MERIIQINDDVAIPAIGIDGFVDKIEISITGTVYRVVHWWDGVRHETWMYEREIRLIAKKKEE
jgi:hypothetical protein